MEWQPLRMGAGQMDSAAAPRRGLDRTAMGSSQRRLRLRRGPLAVVACSFTYIALAELTDCGLLHRVPSVDSPRTSLFAE